MSKSNYLENAIVNAVLRNTAFTSPTTVYVALFTAITDAEANSVTEVSGSSYARVAVTFGAPSNGASTNSAAVTFPVVTTTAYTVVGWGIYDAATVGNLLYHGTLTSQTIAVGNRAEFATGQLSVTEA